MIDAGVEITAIVPTLARRERARALARSIGSIRHATTRNLRILVVVNGATADADIVDWLRCQADVTLLRMPVASAPLAVLEGRGHVQSSHFCFLDDDDEYLEGGLDRRLRVLEQSGADVVVANGYRNHGDVDQRSVEFGVAEDDPLAALFRENWLSSCAGLYRTERIGIEFFEEPHPYVEWTWLAYRLLQAKRRIAFLDEPTFRIHDTPGSASKSDAYKRSLISLHERMLASRPSPDIARIIRARLGSAWHDLAAEHVRAGKLSLALGCHVRSLAYPGGWRFLPFTRHLLAARPGTQAD